MKRWMIQHFKEAVTYCTAAKFAVQLKYPDTISFWQKVHTQFLPHQTGLVIRFQNVSKVDIGGGGMEWTKEMVNKFVQ